MSPVLCGLADDADGVVYPSTWKRTKTNLGGELCVLAHAEGGLISSEFTDRTETDYC